MIVVKVFGLPEAFTEVGMQALCKEIIRAVAHARGSAEEPREDMACFFPSDRMTWELGAEVIVEVTILKALQINDIKQAVADQVGEAVKKACPGSKVACFVTAVRYQVDGVWLSA